MNIDIEKYLNLLDNKTIKVTLVIASLICIYYGGKCVGEFAYYISH